ncbi:MAG TPA: glycogen/starch synthase, partial [Candidatus Enterenecus faecium]|nr:glycogen/starch synthase [Candidatus Enterenecus faecium]
MVHKKARSSKKKTTAKKVVKKAPTPARTVAPVAEPVTAVQQPEPAVVETPTAAKPAAPAAPKTRTSTRKTTSTRKKPASAAKKPAPVAEEPTPVVEETAPVVEETAPVVEEAAPVAEEPAPIVEETTPMVEEAAPAEEEPAPVEEETAPSVEEDVSPVVEEVKPMYEMSNLPRRSIAFIGSECHPFVKTGGLGDVMYALPRQLVKLNCDVRVILPRYACIPQKFQEKMEYRGEFYMDLGNTGRNYYVGIMEYVCDGVVYDFIDNQEFFSSGNPYTNLVDDIPKYCFFSKAALAALNYLNWIPDIVHCHDWQAGLVPVYLRTLFKDSPVGHARSILTIHNLRFQGIYNIPTIRYWSGLPNEVFQMGALKDGYQDANMLKGGIAYADRVTTVSGTYAGEIQTAEYGEHLEGHLRYHSGKLRGIVNGIDYDMWNPATDPALAEHYDLGNVLDHKMANKLALQKELGLEQNTDKFVIGLISRLTNQKGLDLVSSIIPQVLDGNTQVVVLGTGDREYEDTFRSYEYAHRGTFCACIQYDEARAHRIYAGADALLVPSRFEPCGLTQLNAMHYGTLPIVRETGGLKDTVEPYNNFTGDGNGFTFDRYDAGLLLDAINRAKTLYFTNR